MHYRNISSPHLPLNTEHQEEWKYKATVRYASDDMRAKPIS